jgi:osmotically-inducible protein OsmY
MESMEYPDVWCASEPEGTAMKTDLQLKKDVEQELEWDPAISAAGIGVEVRNRIVTLAGHLGSYAEKLAARKAAQKVAGVKGVVIELDVRLPGKDQRNDEDIAEAARAVLQWTAGLGEQAVKVTVESGTVTLSGDLDWGYQMKAAENAVAPLRGVVLVVNQMRVRGGPEQSDVKDRIVDALKRHTQDEANHISVTVLDGTVTLQGRVNSFPDKALACDAAWSAPGVHAVVDRLSVGK